MSQFVSRVNWEVKLRCFDVPGLTANKKAGPVACPQPPGPIAMPPLVSLWTGGMSMLTQAPLMFAYDPQTETNLSVQKKTRAQPVLPGQQSGYFREALRRQGLRRS